MIYSRDQIAQAVMFWGERGQGAVPGLTLAREASKLVDVLAGMDFHQHREVQISEESERGRLIAQALGGGDIGSGAGDRG